MSKYTPSTAEVRFRYTEYPYVAQIKDVPGDPDEFDRWLACVRREAWDEGRNSFGADFLKPRDTFGIRPQTANPYRAANV